uniref:Putative lactoylglutathione lyase (Fragments) n=1 Tax=Pinus strobus TaxID=3348 RepID=LGUL_PINST|nr:RecName: Full=Putative lactoylglutathione lyase; AltName: Full=Aldoketomutase; AltName: Full=Glyoxalase I; Short=Glx I; AltName: Full=Ketone-aldehyde mutase; AltName: Full=Methylglyoxalase; AltName: Full=PS3; AltName: Full=S-D-lactoylglutathione methylglyoxal lyase [Pinus strobus]
ITACLDPDGWKEPGPLPGISTK